MGAGCKRWGKRAKRRGVLTFEWVLLFTVVVIGIIGGAMAVRIAVSEEQTNVERAIDAMNFPSDTSVPILQPALAPADARPASTARVPVDLMPTN
jgi:hypothetical protein